MLPHDLGSLSNLLELDLSNCSALGHLPDSLGELHQLVRLELGFCQGLEQLPATIGKLSSLVELDLLWCVVGRTVVVVHPRRLRDGHAPD